MRTLLVVLLFAGAVPALGQTSSSREAVVGAVEGLEVAAAGDGAKVRRDRSWETLGAGHRLAPGEQVRAGDDPLEVRLRCAGEERGIEGGPRIVIGPGAEATTVALQHLRLDLGRAFVQADRPTTLLVGEDRLTLAAPGDADVEVSRRREVRFVANCVMIVARRSGEEVHVPAGRTGRLRSDGAVEIGDEAPLVPPAWLARTLRVAPQDVLLYEGFEARPGTKFFDGLLRAGAAVGVDARSAPATVYFGSPSDQGGLFRYRDGARLRVRLRVSTSTAVRVTLMNGTQGDNFVASTARFTRAGSCWSELDFVPVEFTDLAKGGKRFAPDDLVTYLKIDAGAPGDAVTLEVDHVVVYVRR